MSDTTNVQKNKLTKEQKKLIYDSLATNIVRFQEYRLSSNKEPEINPETGQPRKRDSLKPDGAIFFEYLCYNSFKLYIEEQTSNGYFYHSYERIEDEYGIGKERVQKITNYLKSLGIVETKVCGFPKNTHYRVRFDNLAKIEVLIHLFRTKPDRTNEIAAHFASIAKIVKLRIETDQEAIEKQYVAEMSWFNHLKKIFYDERAKFNKTVPANAAIKKIQPKPRENTLRNINSGTYLVYYDPEGKERSEQEVDEYQKDFINGFRLYCAIYFLFTCEQSSTNRNLLALAEGDYISTLVNYASGIRDPIAYFFANSEGDLNFIMIDMIDGARQLDMTKGYFSN
ncbi:hypothetical protein [Spirosoma pollinicola]|uniref:Uncharacterized protein n=1 Tax=Spirosoma pollinicola TaxID=2057025 RepID=A0A2K8ZAT9_9BACT|nr:hypothetical protein [Spirosoma pollinicola]AUD06992.1 hypothetical protein CWM47_37345 [Spirosoma pollinicola]